MSNCTIPTCRRTLRPQEAHRTACARCEDRIRAWLREIPHQLVLLEASLEQDRRTTYGDGRGHGGRAHAPMPLREDVLTLLGPAAPGPVHDPHHDQTGPVPLPACLHTWAAFLADERATALPGPLRPSEHINYLAAHLTWACTHHWIAEMHTELHDLIRRVRAITHTQPRRRPLDAPCPGCAAFALTEEDWQPWIDCGLCGRLLTPDEYAEHAAEVLPALYRTALTIIVAAHKTRRSAMTTPPRYRDQ